MKKKTHAIVKTNPLAINTTVAGKGLVDAAADSLKEQKMKMLVDSTALVMKQLEDAKISRKWCEHVCDFLEDKLRALRNGEWSYVEGHNRIIFHRKDLNLTQPEQHRPENMQGLGGRV